MFPLKVTIRFTFSTHQERLVFLNTFFCTNQEKNAHFCIDRQTKRGSEANGGSFGDIDVHNGHIVWPET